MKKEEYQQRAAEMVALLRKEAQAQCLSTYQIAEAVGVSQSTIYRIFDGMFIPSFWVVVGINDCLGNPLKCKTKHEARKSSGKS